MKQNEEAKPVQDRENRCICCGTIIPEGRQVCPACEAKPGRRPVDLTGRRFGRLTVIQRDGSYKDRHAVWLCRCDCGVEFSTSGHNLRQGRVRSCGCIRVHGGADNKSKKVIQ